MEPREADDSGVQEAILTFTWPPDYPSRPVPVFPLIYDVKATATTGEEPLEDDDTLSWQEDMRPFVQAMYIMHPPLGSTLLDYARSHNNDDAVLRAFVDYWTAMLPYIKEAYALDDAGESANE